MGGMKLVLALLVALAAAPVSGCAAIVSNLPAVIAAVTDGMMVVDAIEAFVRRFFAASPNPDLQRKVDVAVSKTRSALSAALRISDGAQKLDQAQVDAAFADFKTAYLELVALVAPLGVQQQGDTLRATPGGGLVVPEPLALRLRVR
jgi:hypothetical protein